MRSHVLGGVQSQGAPAPTGGTAGAWLLALLPPLAAAAVLRGWGLRQQILASDELHTLNGALSRDLGEILTNWTYFGADYCVPLTAGFRVFANLGGVLSEMTLRVPSLFAGLLAVLCIPWALRTRLGRGGAAVLAWGIAISPLLVWYSRIVRSYMPMMLLSFGAVMCFERWWRTGEGTMGAASVVLGALAIYFHLGAAPLVAAPFVYALARMALRPADRAELPRLIGLGIALSLGVALLLLPALSSLRELVGLHGGGGLPPARGWFEVLQLHAGTTSFLPAGVLGVCVLRGAWVLRLRDPDFAAYLLTLGVVHSAGLAVLAPSYLEHPLVASRYLLPLLPFGLALGALGLTAPWRGRVRGWQWAAAVGLGLALFLTGPIPGRLLRTWAFQHSNAALRFTTPGNRAQSEALPEFYRQLAERSGPEPVLEFPWTNVGSRSLDAYQKRHGQPVLVSAASRILAESGRDLRNMIVPQPEAFLASRARWLVVHLDIRQEEARIETADARTRQRLVQLDSFWLRLSRAGGNMSARLESEWGPPDVSEQDIRVWDLERVRRARAAARQR